MTGAIIGGIVVVVVIAAFALVKSKKPSPSAQPSTEVEAKPTTTPAAAPSSSGKKNWLVGASGEVEGKNFWIGNKTVTIGRAANNFVQIVDSDASRMHCRIVPLANGAQVHDMDSSNGIFVNGKKVKRHLLHDQDQLQIGECIFVYHLEGEFTETRQRDNKRVNTDVLRPTMQSNDGDIITQLIVRALQESGGDVVKVAEAVDAPISKIQAIADEHGIATKS